MKGLIEGRIVHYVPENTEKAGVPGWHRAAIVNMTLRSSKGQGVWLTVFDPEKTYIVTSVSYDEKAEKPNTWHWIEGSNEATREEAAAVSHVERTAYEFAAKNPPLVAGKTEEEWLRHVIDTFPRIEGKHYALMFDTALRVKGCGCPVCGAPLVLVYEPSQPIDTVYGGEHVCSNDRAHDVPKGWTKKLM